MHALVWVLIENDWDDGKEDLYENAMDALSQFDNAVFDWCAEGTGRWEDAETINCYEEREKAIELLEKLYNDQKRDAYYYFLLACNGNDIENRGQLEDETKLSNYCLNHDAFDSGDLMVRTHLNTNFSLDRFSKIGDNSMESYYLRSALKLQEGKFNIHSGFYNSIDCDADVKSVLTKFKQRNLKQGEDLFLVPIDIHY